MTKDTPLLPIDVIIVGYPDTGKTTIARLIEFALHESGFTRVTVSDLPPSKDKPPFEDRFVRNKQRPVRIKVQLP